MLRTRVVMERGGGQWSEGAGAHFWLGTCHAFSSSRGLSGRGPGRGGPHRPHHAPPPDQKACTLGRRPDIFNGDAARILGQQPQTAQQQLPDQPARAPAARSPAAVLPATPAPAATHGLASASAAASTLVLTPSSADPASAAALWCDQLRRLHRTATATQRRLDGLLRDLDTLELGTGPELRAAERLGKVLATYLSFAFPGAMEPPEEPGTSLARPGMSSSSSTTGSSSSSSSSGSGSSRDSSSKGWAFHGAHRASGREQQQPVAPESSVGHLRSLLARVEAAAAQLADIGRRHEAGAYAPLRRFYFSPDEPLQAISLRSEQYRRQLEGAAVACGPDSPEVRQRAGGRAGGWVGWSAKCTVTETHRPDAARGGGRGL